MADTVDKLTKKERNANAVAILNALDPDKHNFNTMMTGFVDIIQSNMYLHLRSKCKSPAEEEALNKKLTKGMYEVAKAIDQSVTNPAEDMVVLAGVMLDTINRAMLRQEELGLSVSRSIVTKAQKTQ